MKTYKKPGIRLTKDIIPNKYSISLKPDLEAFTFEGTESMELQLKRPVKEITLHSKEINIETVEFLPNGKNSTGIFCSKISYSAKAETATFVFPQAIKKGSGILKIVFRGILNDKMRGFYRSKYTHQGKEKHMATTQFEATDARRAFPCFDEPAQKAVFDVSLIIPSHTNAISNTLPTSIKEHEAGYKIVKFEPTPKMSTYLLAFIVGEFEFIEGKTKDGTLVRVFTTPGKKHQAKFALDCGIKVLEFYNKYFNIPYPLPTLDMIAIPDFASGAMENWGAVTYRESALLVDEQNSSSANKQWVALVIAHELAHQWFGNLVTMEWWTHLWLNEGFASYIEYLAVDHLFPEWDIWTQFAYADLGVALQLDSLANTHPIEVDVHNPNEIGEIFDEVSYQKGSSVIRMLAGYLGEKDFRDGLRYYLKKHAYANAFTEDLWDAFEKISKKPVRKMMRNWTSRGGYPLLKVEDGGQKGQNRIIKLSQERFFSSPFSKKANTAKTAWFLPVSTRTSLAKDPIINILTAAKSNITLPIKSKWSKFNVGETGFFRTRYPHNLLEQLRQPVEEKILPPIDRLGLVRDLFALEQAGEINVAEVLSFVECYKNEDDYTVWVELASGLDALDNLMFGQEFYNHFRSYCKNIFSPLAQKVGWVAQSGEKHTRVLLRGLALSHAGYYGDEKVIAESKRLFKEKNAIHPDLRGVVYSLASQYGDGEVHDRLLEMYTKEQMHEERNRLGRAMGMTRNKTLAQKTLEFAFSGNVRLQDSPLLVAASFNNVYVREIVWNFIKKHWKAILQRYGEGGHMLPRFVRPAGNFCDQGNFKDVRQFFKSNPTPGADRALRQTLEEIRANIAWLKRDIKPLKEFLS